ncbi:MAG TPA: hypothetical protein VFS50_16385 [Meiothermus sp.]|nr:hypothetical protein [Meiothermus sp.]
MTAKPHTYIVRVWAEPNPVGPGAWRASVLDTVSQERHYFSTPQDLARFLQETEGDWLQEDPPEEG